MAVQPKVSTKSMEILRLIAKGRSYAQIVDSGPDITYIDVFSAASEALQALEAESESHSDRLQETKKRHPRAYERWSDAELEELATVFLAGQTFEEIADHLGRQPSAIRSRLLRLGLLEPDQASKAN